MAGVKSTVPAAVVIISAITPLSVAGSVPSLLDASAVRLALLVYTLTHAALLTVILIKPYALNPVKFLFSVIPDAILLVVVVIVVLDSNPSTLIPDTELST